MDFKRIKNNKSLAKYYAKRYTLFTRFDDGIMLDRESWYSVTPEKVAEHIALKCLRSLDSSHQIVLDAFSGCGGNTIQFARFFTHTIANDIDKTKLDYAKHNATLYSVDQKVEFVCCDYKKLFEMCLHSNLKPNLIFISPPWGGVHYSRSSNKQIYDLYNRFPINLKEIFDLAVKVTKNLILFLPRNSNLDQICNLAKPLALAYEIEQNFLDGKLVSISVYFGDLVDSNTRLT